MGSEVKELAQSKSANFNIPFLLRMNLHTKIIRMLQAQLKGKTALSFAPLLG